MTSHELARLLNRESAREERRASVRLAAFAFLSTLAAGGIGALVALL